ncbi:ATP-binding cassette domain-containing protein [Enterobacteriaceae endosymbiont of Donacia tomentosa]|uniref:ATP-binding cassette domain-containing protein n=1 Tax=Enterobacteriaceae endosymbiont of Donacia tomentosa TaxID=2675787 RepID=UPI001449C8A9|nr:ATP-binding cassette domain-containing protein [Enterobacteriaceae endosymbiont of Donacia tomentosa]QJC31854.1 ATP-binding cassette domain-containing protein [Enterobacteriaceae endosymbiont of Donacia tomentosa]
MKEFKEKKIIDWLIKQSTFIKYKIQFSFLLSIINIILLIIQNWLLTRQIESFFLPKNKNKFFTYYVTLFLCFIIRSLLKIIINKINYNYSQIIKNSIRKKILDKITQKYYEQLKKKNLGINLSLIIDQIECLQDFYSIYIPQIFLSKILPFIILITVFFISWIVSILLIIISIFTIIFIILIGSKTSEKNKKNLKILSIINGLFLDRLRGIETIRLFNLKKIEISKISIYIEKFRKKNIEILKIIFLTSVVLEFFSAFAMAFIAMYFSFMYLNIIHFGSYSNITILKSFFILILVSEYFQYFNNLGVLYHIKSKAIGAADAIIKIIKKNNINNDNKNKYKLFNLKKLKIKAQNLIVRNSIGKILIGPLSFNFFSGQNIVINGPSGCGKTTLFNVLLGKVSYEGSLKINNLEFKKINLDNWYKQISFVSQNPELPAINIKKNLFFKKELNINKIKNIIYKIGILEFLKKLPNGINTIINNQNICLSVGQIQKIVIARALIKDHILLLLDEPIANIDIKSQYDIMKIMQDSSFIKTSLTITHKIYKIDYYDEIWYMDKGKITKKIYPQIKNE